MRELPALLGRLVAFGPVIYLGLYFLIDPGKTAAVLEAAADGIQRFALHLQPGPHRWPARRCRIAFRNPAALRWCGLVLTVYGVLCLSGLNR